MGHALELESGSVLLRRPKPEDGHDFLQIVTNPAFNRYSPLAPMTPDSAKRALDALIQNHDEKVHQFWSVIDKKSQKYAGFVGYNPVLFEKSTHEMFFLSFYDQFWKSILPIETARLARDYAFDHQIKRLIAFVHPQDYSSLRCFYHLPGKLEREEVLFYGITVYLFSISP